MAISVRLQAARDRLPAFQPGLMAPAVIGALVYLVLAPLVLVVVSSLKLTKGYLPFEPEAPWSIANYGEVFLDPGTYSVLVNTLVFSVASLAIALVISGVLAWLVERTDMPFGHWVFALIVASIGIPGVISAIAWSLLLNPTNGVINLALRAVIPVETGPFDVYTMYGLVFAESLTLVPVTYLLITASFRTMDSTLEDAGFASGASRWTVTRLITIPMLTPALMGALIYQFVNVIASFDLPLIIGLRAGIPLLSTEIFANARPLMGIPDFGIAATYSMVLLALALGPLLVYGRLIGRSERFATISGHGFRPRQIELGRGKIPALLFAFVFIVLSFLLPLFVLVWMSVQPFYSPPSAESFQRITFEAYQRMVDSPTISPVFLNTFIVCGLTALGTMTLGFLVGWLIVRTRSRLRVALDILSFIPNILPGVIIGLSVLLFYFMLPVRLYGTLWIVVVGLTTQLITLATRLMTGSIAQINKQLEEAGSASGAGRWPVLRRIVLPLVRPAFVNGLLLVFLVSMQHLTVPLMLSTPNNTVITAAIYSEWDHGDTSMAGALGVVVVTITVTLAAVLRAFRGALQ